MKTLLTLLVLFFSSSVVAEDISDFQIEGISIGDSLLDYFSEDEIKKGKRNYKYKNDEFFTVEIYEEPSFNQYQNLSFRLKSNDTKYLIYGLSGFDFIDNSNNECFDKVDIVTNEISKILDENKKIQSIRNHDADPTGKSKIKKVEWWFESNDLITVECWDWSKQISKNKGWGDNFSVTFLTEEYMKWINLSYKN